MDHVICLNNLSVPAENQLVAYDLLNNSFQGILHLNGGGDRYLLYYDGDSITSCEFATNYNLNNYKEDLQRDNEVDLLSFIYEIEDKSPLIEQLSDDEFEQLAISQIYFQGRPYVKADIFGYAYLNNYTMMSLQTNDMWAEYYIEFNIIKGAGFRPIKCKVYNVSSRAHALAIRQDSEKTLQQEVANINYSNSFNAWYATLLLQDKIKIKNKIIHCNDNEFQIGRPIVDTIRDSDYPNMKEICVGNAYGSSGKIRILFASDTNQKINILVGFIKHSNDYSDEIKEADSIFRRVLSN